MAEGENGFKFYAESHPVAETYFADGTVTSRSMVVTGGLTDSETREAAAEMRGVPVDDVTIENGNRIIVDSRKQKAGKMSVAFSANNWHSSWDPKADPTLN